jgi:hypothetical protein
MRLSRFFELSEMTRSDTAQRERIPNEPDESAREALAKLCTEVLDPLRDAIGRPITVNSGYRGPALNRRIGGASGSQHVEGKAADIQCSGTDVLGLFQRIIRLGLPFDQLIYEARSATAKWVHVSHNAAGNRGQIMIARFDDAGRPVAYPRVSADEALAMREPVRRTRGVPRPLEYIEMGDEPEAAERLPQELAGAVRPSAGSLRQARTAARGAGGRPAKQAVSASSAGRPAPRGAPSGRSRAKKRSTPRNVAR